MSEVNNGGSTNPGFTKSRPFATVLDEMAKRANTGRGRGTHNKGRQATPAARGLVRQLLGDGERRRDLLLEFLHRIQDQQRQLPLALLAALAEELGLSQAEVFEVATFYAHFEVVEEADESAPLVLRVCEGLPCALEGAAELFAALAARTDSSVRLKAAPCMGRCEAAPVVALGHNHLTQATPDGVAKALEAGASAAPTVSGSDFAAYRQGGGYALYQSCREGQRQPDDIIAELEAAGLRGLGGAGFPAARKWRLVAAEAAPRYLVVNADEGEPGTFKDRHYLESDPHRMLEGALIAAWAVGAEAIYIYLRDEYPQIRAWLEREIPALRAGDIAELPAIHLRRGAGAYICGEESAMLESLEGRRGLPRHKPPFPSQAGLFGRPTLINNVETLHWVRDIVERGAAWFSGAGRHGASGWRSFSVSGRVHQPGVKLAPAGITLNELIAEHCGGMAEGHRLEAYLPGGASGGILPARLADVALDFGSLEEHGAFIGSAAIIVLSQHDNLGQVARNLMGFFADESCGQCTPCRLGCEKALALMAEESWDGELLGELGRAMTEASICGLGQAAPNVFASLLRYWPEEVS